MSECAAWIDKEHQGGIEVSQRGGTLEKGRHNPKEVYK
jgi:hypothetical protein